MSRGAREGSSISVDKVFSLFQGSSLDVCGGGRLESLRGESSLAVVSFSVLAGVDW